jgi:hypothetical protein
MPSKAWRPVQTGPQNLYPLDLQFETGAKVSDSSSIRFGVREVTSEIDAQGHRLYHSNGKNGGVFRNLKEFNEVLNARYGQANSVEEYARKAAPCLKPSGATSTHPRG